MPLPNQNWIVDPRGRPPLLSRPNPNMGTPPGGTLPGGISGGAQGYTREVQANELAGTHMEDLGRGDNRVLQQARARGAAAGASRGGINSNLAAAGGEQAWLDAAGQVAMQQAGAYGNAATQNLDSLGRQRISAEGNATQIETAGIGASASMYASDNNLISDRERNILDRARMGQDRELTMSGRDFQRSEREGDQSFRSGESQRDRDYNTGRDETQHGYQREIERDRYGYDQESEDNRANRESDQYLFRQLIDNPEEFDTELLNGMQNFFQQFRANYGRNRPK